MRPAMAGAPGLRFGCLCIPRDLWCNCIGSGIHSAQSASLRLPFPVKHHAFTQLRTRDAYMSFSSALKSE